MEIDVLGKDSLYLLDPNMDNCRFLPLKEHGISKNSILNHIVDRLYDSISRGSLAFVARDQGQIVGVVCSERLDWDSRHFGIDISKITYLLSSGDYTESLAIKEKLLSRVLLESCKKLTFHVTARVSKEDISSIHALENIGFQLMDVLVTYTFDLQKQPICTIEPLCLVRQFRDDDMPALIEIARESFGDSAVATDRFHGDPTLPNEKSDELYVKWLVDSAQDINCMVFVAEENGKPIGFNTCIVNKSLEENLEKRIGTMSLTAVKPSERGKQVAVSLLTASLKWFKDKADIVETGGQASNYNMQRAWVKTGFKISKSQCTFRWSILPDIT